MYKRHTFRKRGGIFNRAWEVVTIIRAIIGYGFLALVGLLGGTATVLAALLIALVAEAVFSVPLALVFGMLLFNRIIAPFFHWGQAPFLLAWAIAFFVLYVVNFVKPAPQTVKKEK